MMNRISVREFARLNGLTLETVYRRLWAGKLVGVKVDGKWMIEVPGTQTTTMDLNNDR